MQASTFRVIKELAVRDGVSRSRFLRDKNIYFLIAVREYEVRIQLELKIKSSIFKCFILLYINITTVY